MIDFTAIAARALASSETLLTEWLPSGRKQGDEYVALNPTRADRNLGSFLTNVRTGVWKDFATGDGGADLISLYAYLQGVENGPAARAIAKRLGIGEAGDDAPSGNVHTASAREASRWTPVTPVPDTAPPPPPKHWRFGTPTAQWRYTDAESRTIGYVCRFDPPGERKQILPLVFARGANGELAWKWTGLPAPRPLYNLPALTGFAQRPVLVVEGEKCVDNAKAEVGEAFVVTTWAGGSNALDRTDWTPLKDRVVTLWPDADAQRDRHGMLLPADAQPGKAAMTLLANRLVANGARVFIVDLPAPGKRPHGWDVADAIAEGLRGDALVSWIRDRAQAVKVEAELFATEVPDGDSAANDDWRRQLTRRGERFEASLRNVALVLEHCSDWQGVLGYDQFNDIVTKRCPPPWRDAVEGPWTDVDDTLATIWLEAHKFQPFGSRLVAEAVATLAHRFPFHPVRDFLSTLAWDGTVRLDNWMSIYLGVQETPYSRLVGCYFLIGMIARVMEPGCQFDYMLVLEGEQGTGKTSALQILGGEWFGNTDLRLSDKDAILGLQNIWLYEFSELDALAKAEATHQKSFISRRADDVRPPYGRRSVRRLRQVVFCGSTNMTEYNKDPTGGRRFWSVATGKIDKNGFAAVRDQLLAEAAARYHAGARRWPTPEEQRQYFDPEQSERQHTEPFVQLIGDWVRAHSEDEFTMAEVIKNALGVPAAQMLPTLTTRVGIALKRLGCTRVETRTGPERRKYRRPESLRPDVPAPSASNQGDSENDVPI